MCNPLKDDFYIASTLSGLKRGKGAGKLYKLPVDITLLRKIHQKLNLDHIEDSRLWTAILCCFFGLLRISNVTVLSQKPHCHHQQTLKRSDFRLCNQGCILSVRWSKTIQHRDRVLDVTLPFIKHDCICPTSAILRFFSQTSDVPSDCPLLSVCQKGKPHFLTQETVRRRLKQLLASVGLASDRYGTHSLRRGGATWMLVSGVPLDMVKVLGDWKSDAVYQYLKPQTQDKFQAVTKALTCSQSS